MELTLLNTLGVGGSRAGSTNSVPKFLGENEGTLYQSTPSNVLVGASRYLNTAVIGGVSGTVTIPDEVHPFSAYTYKDQSAFDEILSNNFDVISNNRLFEKLKDYEHAYAQPSGSFYIEWKEGKKNSSPQIHDWMNTYKTLFLINGKPAKSD